MNLRQTIDDLSHLRLSGWWALAIVALIVVAIVAPTQLQVDVHQVSRLALGAVAGYILDCQLMPYARPHDLYARFMGSLNLPMLGIPQAIVSAVLGVVFGLAMLRRAAVVGACMVVMAG
jgi:hypothetical protein